jgi:hypothetical protein
MYIAATCAINLPFENADDLVHRVTLAERVSVSSVRTCGGVSGCARRRTPMAEFHSLVGLTGQHGATIYNGWRGAESTG